MEKRRQEKVVSKNATIKNRNKKVAHEKAYESRKPKNATRRATAIIKNS